MEKPSAVDVEALKALVEDSPVRMVRGVVEERVGGEAWHGSMAVMTTSTKRHHGSAFKQVNIVNT